MNINTNISAYIKTESEKKMNIFKIKRTKQVINGLKIEKCLLMFQLVVTVCTKIITKNEIY